VSPGTLAQTSSARRRGAPGSRSASTAGMAPGCDGHASAALRAAHAARRVRRTTRRQALRCWRSHASDRRKVHQQQQVSHDPSGREWITRPAGQSCQSSQPWQAAQHRARPGRCGERARVTSASCRSWQASSMLRHSHQSTRVRARCSERGGAPLPHPIPPHPITPHPITPHPITPHPIPPHPPRPRTTVTIPPHTLPLWVGRGFSSPCGPRGAVRRTQAAYWVCSAHHTRCPIGPQAGSRVVD
jgi:hypothetical protein